MLNHVTAMIRNYHFIRSLIVCIHTDIYHKVHWGKLMTDDTFIFVIEIIISYIF